MITTIYQTTRCPACQSLRVGQTAGARSRGAVVVRYHLCLDCRFRFRSREGEPPALSVTTTTTTGR